MIERPTTVDDIISFKPADGQKTEWRDVILRDPHAAEYLGTYARTVATEDGQIAMIAGVMPLREGVAELWAGFGALAHEHPAVTMRHLRNLLKLAYATFSFHRLQAVNATTQDQTSRVLAHLGFEHEGILDSYYEAGTRYRMYAKVTL